MPSWDAIWCRSLRRLRSRVLNSVTLLLLLVYECGDAAGFLGLLLSKLGTLQPGFGLECVNGIQESYHTGRGGHSYRVGPDPTPEVLDTPEGLARRHAGGGEDHVVAPDQVVRGKLAPRRGTS